MKDSAQPSRLVLFDIDGTLLTTNGNAGRSMMAAYHQVYGVVPAKDLTGMNGKTELRIAYELLGRAGLSREQVEAGLPEFWRHYLRELSARLAGESPTVFPGVPAALKMVMEREEMLMGLITGNIEASAEVKLTAAGLRGFRLGAYGQHHEERADLPALAVASAKKLTGASFAGKRITIIGDTPADITCGAALGVKTIAVATGVFAADELARHHPDYLFTDLSDTEALLAALLAE